MFTFSSGPIKSIKLKEIITLVIKECHRVGLEVVATVCDQGAANQAAINSLLEKTKVELQRNNLENRYFGFLVDGREIVPLYDVPHLFKGLRNNLLTKDLHFEMNGEKKVAKWSHIEQLYSLDIKEPSLRICSKLTDAHVIKDKINKMKVSYCTQVFSHSVGALLKRISQWDTKDSNNLESEASQTGDLILFLDQLFDSLNGQSKTAPPTKPLKASVTKNSNHQQFWNNSLEIINSMRFYCNKKKAYVRNPSLKNMQFTLRGFLYLKNVLLHEKQFSYILTRPFNQDPLENFFSYIRSYGSRNTNPDASHFLTSFKALIVNNFMSAHSPHSNCEEDTNTYALDNLRSFLTGQYIEGIQPIETPSENVCLPLDIPFYQKTKVARCTITYMSGYIARVLLKYCKNCEISIRIKIKISFKPDNSTKHILFDQAVSSSS